MHSPVNMRPWIASLLLASSLSAQATVIPDNGGNGSDGVFAPSTNVTLDTSIQALYQFTSMTVPSGVTVQVIGPAAATIRVIGPVIIDGVLEGSGQSGAVSNNNTPGGVGGAGGPGGGVGGDGGCLPANLFAGDGTAGGGRRPGTGGRDLMVGGAFGDSGGGGGGGNAGAGANAPTTNQPTPGLEGLGGAAGLCRAGAGGGGGACDVDSLTTGTSNDGGGGGGGGGGRISITSNSSITIGATGVVRCDGGAGGQSAGNGGSGGGGAGGMIEFAAPNISVNGTCSAVGGPGGGIGQSGATTPGGDGGNGCIYAIGNYNLTGTVTPVATVLPGGLLLTTASPGGNSSIVPTNQAQSVFTGLSEALLPVSIPLFGGNLFVDPTTQLFALSLGQPSVGGLINGLSGAAGTRTVQVNPAALAAFPGLELDLYFQGILVQLPNIAGISDLGAIYFKY